MSKRSSIPLLSDTHAPLRETLDVLAERELRQRRRVLSVLGGAATAAAFLPIRAMACSLIPAETGGPYPGDGTNGPNVLTQSGIVRSDIRSSFGASGTTAAAGTPTLITLRMVSSTTSCAVLPGLAIYLWHCDATGGYSMYSSGVATQNYLRGVQVSNTNGEATFLTIFPGCYPGRWPHIHFEVYASLTQAVAGQNAIRTSQLALPEASCRQVYAQTALYPSSTSNLNSISLASDNVFSNDSGVTQLASVTGSIANGYEATLEVGVAVAPTVDTGLVFSDGFE